MKLSVHLVTWNGAKYIPFLFDSLKKQTFKDWKLVVLDNGSTDGTVDKIQQETGNWKLETGGDIEFIEEKTNLGFAGGHNKLFCSMLHVPCYMLLLNQDMYLMPDCLEKLVKFMDGHGDVAALAPRIMKWNFNEGKFTDNIDSIGLKVFRNRRVVEIGEGEKYQDKHKESNFVFGVSGAVVLFRKEVIGEIGFLDESFQSYKEDVDLAFRLNSAGWKSAVLYDAVAYHDRAGGGSKHKDDISSIKNKLTQKPWVRYHSYKNHLMTLYKNEYWQNFLLDFPWILWYELRKLVYFVLFDRGVLKGLGEIWRMRKGLRDKRYEIRDKRKVDWRNMREILKK